MARRENNGERLLPVAVLRAKYLDLTRKYTALVERFERRFEVDDTLQRLGRWALSASGSGLALVDKGKLRSANERFLTLERIDRWRRSGAEPLLPLRSIVLVE